MNAYGRRFNCDRGGAVTEYRVYIVGDDGHFLRAIQLDCPDDRAAIESAKQLIDGHDIELWQRDRRIARFDTRSKDTAGWLRGELKRPE
jgi:hypothetical protein